MSDTWHWAGESGIATFTIDGEQHQIKLSPDSFGTAHYINEMLDLAFKSGVRAGENQVVQKVKAVLPS